MRLISAMTSNTSESELLGQVLSSSESHSDSLELSDGSGGQTWTRTKKSASRVFMQIPKGPKSLNTKYRLFSQQISEGLLHTTVLSDPTKSYTAHNAVLNIVGKIK